MTSRSYFGKMNSTLGSVVPLAMFELLTSIQMISLLNRHSLPLPDTIIKSAETDECVAPWLLGDFDSDTHF